jgi:uncharacterized protein YaiL (DUF2058 family)
MGLRDQLLKAGLVSKKQAQKVDSESRRVQHVAHKNAAVASELSAQALAEQKNIEEEQSRKKEADRQRNLELEAERLEKEKLYRVRQLLKSNDLQEPSADNRYFFRASDTRIASLLVTPFQREMIARGKIGIVRTENSEDQEFLLVPAHTVHTVRNILPARFALLHPAVEDWQDVGEIVEKEYWRESEVSSVL